MLALQAQVEYALELSCLHQTLLLPQREAAATSALELLSQLPSAASGSHSCKENEIKWDRHCLHQWETLRLFAGYTSYLPPNPDDSILTPHGWVECMLNNVWSGAGSLSAPCTRYTCTGTIWQLEMIMMQGKRPFPATLRLENSLKNYWFAGASHC